MRKRMTSLEPKPAPSVQDPPLAYRDLDFLDSDDGRPIRIVAEYLQPLHAFRQNRVHDTIAFFGSARIREDGPQSRFYRDARELARRVTEWSEGLQGPGRRFLGSTGGGPGIMEAANRGALDAGGRSIGVDTGLAQAPPAQPVLTPGPSLHVHFLFHGKPR